jgi:hypothetical protein
MLTSLENTATLGNYLSKTEIMKSCMTSALIFFIGIFIIVLIINASGDKKNKEGYVTESSPPHALLAVLETGQNPPPIAVVNRFDTVLSSLSAKCPSDSKSRISDYIFRGQEILKKEGIKVGLLELANAFDQSMSSDAIELKIQCREALAALVTLMSPK